MKVNNLLGKKNNVECLNDFFDCDMRFIVLHDNTEGPIKYVSDLESEERFIFVITSPTVYED